MNAKNAYCHRGALVRAILFSVIIISAGNAFAQENAETAAMCRDTDTAVCVTRDKFNQIVEFMKKLKKDLKVCEEGEKNIREELKKCITRGQKQQLLEADIEECAASREQQSKELEQAKGELTACKDALSRVREQLAACPQVEPGTPEPPGTGLLLSDPEPLQALLD